MLQTPSLIDTLGHVLFLPPVEVGSMKHRDFDSVTKSTNQWGEQRRT